jgi:glycosyl-4,4'-diaponeurosporenoate acyltransferase
MRIVHLSLFWTIVVDCIAWTLIQPAVAYLSIQIPRRALDPAHWLFRTRSWERNGQIYQTLFRVQAWKGWLPSGGTLFGGYPMKELQSRDPDHLRIWIAETCRAELCHWLAILPSAIFFLWNPPWLGVVMIVYALAFNAVPILTQRHNRPRLLAILRHRTAQGDRV